MSIGTYFEIRCDAPVDIGLREHIRCPMVLHVETLNAATAVLYAEHCGWRFKSGHDYCPECARKLDLKCQN